MATRQDFIQYICEQSGLGARLSNRKMFGEYALYVDGKVVALVCDNSLYVKPTKASETLQVLLATAAALPAPKETRGKGSAKGKTRRIALRP
jgi:TfoX/Sxy family transcriptional regulator of competence genes